MTPQSAGSLVDCFFGTAEGSVGKVSEAAGLFDPKVFTAEKQSDEVRRAYIEVQLQKLLAGSVNPDQCPVVLNAIENLGEEDKSLPFTFHSFGSFIKAAHFQYYLAIVEANCGQQKNARKRLEKVSRMKESLPSAEVAFPLLAAAKLNPLEAKPRIGAALESVRASLPRPRANRASPCCYVEAMLLHAAGQEPQAGQRLQEVLGRPVTFEFNIWRGWAPERFWPQSNLINFVGFQRSYQLIAHMGHYWCKDPETATLHAAKTLAAGRSHPRSG